MACAAFGCLLAAAVCARAADLPDLAAVRAAHLSSDARLLDRNGETLAEVRIDHTRRRLDWVPVERFSPALRSALIASEDKRFYEHSGVDWQALAGAMWDNLRRGVEGRRPRGASTLTMQLAGMLDESLRLRGSMRTIEQKWDQALAARELEKHWSKAQILEAYLNLAIFRGELVGIAAASRGLFGKSPDEIDAAEAAILAALLRGPNAPPHVVGRRACAVAAHLPQGASCGAVMRLSLAALPGPHRTERPNDAPHLARRLLGRPATAVWTTVDAAVQRACGAALQRHLARAHGALEGAVLVLDNASGDVVAYVGANPESPEAVDGVLAPRPVGAGILPFLYGLALERRNLTAASVLDDSALNLAPPPGLPLAWESDGGYRGPVSVRTALAAFLSAPALRTLSVVGTDVFQERLDAIGFDRHSTLASLLAMTNAYRTLAVGGEISPARVTQEDPPGALRRVMRRDASFIVTDILARPPPPGIGFDKRGAGLWAAFASAVAGGGRDGWGVGFTERYTIGVRLGAAVADALRDDEGASIVASLWREIVGLLHAGVASRPQRPPPGVVSRLTRFEPPVEPPRREWFMAGTELELVGANVEPPVGPPRIAYPAFGAVILINPESAGEERVLFLARNGVPGLRWRVDGTRLEAEGAQAPWRPAPGRHRLALLDPLGAEVDAVDFDVRVAEHALQPAQQQGGKQ